MSLFLDASALVAMLAREPEATTFSHIVAHDADRVTSAVAIWEATRGLASARGVSFEESRAVVADYLQTFEVRIVPIAQGEAELALDAHQRFGKGHHEARLNMGDCFAYACAKLHAEALLFKGEDFNHTDVRDATLP